MTINHKPKNTTKTNEAHPSLGKAAKQTLIQRQETCIARMSEARTSERRAAKNRNAAIAKYRETSLKLGYTAEETNQQIHDIRDMYELEKNAEE